MKFWQKKDKYQKLQGLTGSGDDYNVYVLSQYEYILALLIGFATGFFASNVMFANLIVSIIIGTTFAFLAVPRVRDFLFKRRRKAMTLQFRDMLESLSNSFAAGRNTSDAFLDAYNDLAASLGSKSVIARELKIINNGLYNNYNIEELLEDMAKRCGLIDMSNFADTFAVCNRLGANLKKIIAETRDIISDKIEVEMEIQTSISASKNEINIMIVMPFLIIPMMNTLGSDAISANSLSNVIVKLIALGLFALAYKIGKKITDIQV